jgi:hypothetical protein
MSLLLNQLRKLLVCFSFETVGWAVLSKTVGYEHKFMALPTLQVVVSINYENYWYVLGKAM